MMNADPNSRLTLDEIIMDPWTQGPIPDHEEVVIELLKHTNTTCTTDSMATTTNDD